MRTTTTETKPNGTTNLDDLHPSLKQPLPASSSFVNLPVVFGLLEALRTIDKMRHSIGSKPPTSLIHTPPLTLENTTENTPTSPPAKNQPY